MVDGVKGYTLPQGFAALFDPSAMEQQYAAGIARAGTPAGLLQTGMNDARAQREYGLQQLLGLNADMQDRTDALNQKLIDADRLKQLLGIYEKGFNENPAMPELMVPIIRQLSPLLGLTEAGTNYLGERALGAGRRRDENDEARRFQQTGEGTKDFREGGVRVATDKPRTADELRDQPMSYGDPTSIERERIQQAGMNNRQGKTQFIIESDDAGGLKPPKIVAPTPEAAAQAWRGWQRTQGQEPGQPGDVSPTPQSEQRPVTRDEVRQSQQQMSPGGAKADASYGSVTGPKSYVQMLKDIDAGAYDPITRRGFKLTPDPQERGWTRTDQGDMRTMIAPDGKRYRVIATVGADGKVRATLRLAP